MLKTYILLFRTDKWSKYIFTQHLTFFYCNNVLCLLFLVANSVVFCHVYFMQVFLQLFFFCLVYQCIWSSFNLIIVLVQHFAAKWLHLNCVLTCFFFKKIKGSIDWFRIFLNVFVYNCNIYTWIDALVIILPAMPPSGMRRMPLLWLF